MFWFNNKYLFYNKPFPFIYCNQGMLFLFVSVHIVACADDIKGRSCSCIYIVHVYVLQIYTQIRVHPHQNRSYSVQEWKPRKMISISEYGSLLSRSLSGLKVNVYAFLKGSDRRWTAVGWVGSISSPSSSVSENMAARTRCDRVSCWFISSTYKDHDSLSLVEVIVNNGIWVLYVALLGSVIELFYAGFF